MGSFYCSNNNVKPSIWTIKSQKLNQRNSTSWNNFFFTVLDLFDFSSFFKKSNEYYISLLVLFGKAISIDPSLRSGVSEISARLFVWNEFRWICGPHKTSGTFMPYQSTPSEVKCKVWQHVRTVTAQCSLEITQKFSRGRIRNQQNNRQFCLKCP